MALEGTQRRRRVTRQAPRSFQRGSKLDLWLLGARASSRPTGTHNSFLAVFSATSLLGKNDREVPPIPSLAAGGLCAVLCGRGQGSSIIQHGPSILCRGLNKYFYRLLSHEVPERQSKVSRQWKLHLESKDAGLSPASSLNRAV